MTLDSSTRKRRPGQTMKASERRKAQDAFIQAFGQTANVKASCMEAGIDRSLVYVWLEHNVEFSIRYRQAEQDADDVIRAAVVQRGIQGVPQPVVSGGKLVYTPDGSPLTVQKYSDSLLGLLARARLPEFKEKQPIPDTDPEQLEQEWVNLREVIFQALEPFPEARLAVAKALLALGRGDDQQLG